MKVQQSIGNVFGDLGFGVKEGESLRLRAELMMEVKGFIKAQRLSEQPRWHCG